RGPQGTLFGAGSLAGTVRYISNAPELGVSRFFGEATGGLIDGGSPGGPVKVGLNQPIGSRTALRVAGYWSGYGGYMDAVRPDMSVENDVNGGNRTGVRAALLFEPTERLRITPRLTYQRLEMDGWNRIDDYNILANPYTTSRPPVTLGERQLFLAEDEPYTDDFLLGDLRIEYALGGANLTSVTSFMDRDLVVTRDGGALYASIVGGSIGLPEPVYTLSGPFDDVTSTDVFTQEIRLDGESGRFRWLVGGFYSHQTRDYGQSVLVPGFEDITGIPTEGLRASRDELFFSDLSYDLSQLAFFGEATLGVTERLDLTAGLRFYTFDEDRDQVFDGIFTNDNTGTEVISVPGSTNADGIAPRFIASYDLSDDFVLNAQASKGFRLGGINDPLNTPVCTPEDLVTFGGRDSWTDETVWNYEVGMKSRLMGGRAGLNVSAYYMDINDLQLIVTAGSCSSRLVFNVPDARSQGLEAEFSMTPNEHFDFAVSASVNDAELQSTVTSTSAGGQVSVVSGIEEGNRLPSVPEFQAAAAATYQWDLTSDLGAFVSGSFQHVGSRITQIDDNSEGYGVVDLEALDYIIGEPLTQSTFTFDPELPAYSLLNLRLGVTRGRWEVTLFANNLTDERAFLALDRERDRLARVGYLTNQPRTIGLGLRFGN
ncbi:MAG: TonB-dependent receptor, partial [Gemmatimonadota bacterium]|nr:TonB-dependent receptor [Gemmatimonadota bacterium]